MAQIGQTVTVRRNDKALTGEITDTESHGRRDMVFVEGDDRGGWFFESHITNKGET